MKTIVTMRQSSGQAWTGGPRLISRADSNDEGAVSGIVKLDAFELTVEQARTLSAALLEAAKATEKLIARAQAQAAAE